MQYRVAPLLGVMLFIEAAAFAVCLLLSLVLADGAWLGFAVGAVATLLAGTACYKIPSLLAARHHKVLEWGVDEVQSYALTLLVWIVVPLAGAIPFLFRGMDLSGISLIDALFESFSGFSTTGCTTLVPEALPASLLFWRSATQWLGGLGLLLLLVIFVPGLGISARHLYDTEFSGNTHRRFAPRIRNTVVRLYGVYAVLTLAIAVILSLTENNVLVGTCLSMSVVSTGGFMPYSQGLAPCSDLTLLLLSVFMLLAGMSISMLYCFGTFRWRYLRQNGEWRCYMLLFLIGSVALAVSGVAHGTNVAAALRNSLFSMASAVSTCGYYVNADIQPTLFASFLFMMLLFVGACSGSTGGGIKVKRVLMVFKYVRNYFMRMHHPNVVFCVKVNGQLQTDDYINKIFAFIFLYVSFILCGIICLLLCDCSLTEAFTLAASSLANAGASAGVAILGHPINIAQLVPAAKCIVMLLMVAGRIEIYAFVALFLRLRR